MKLGTVQAASVLLLGMCLPICQAQDKPEQEGKPKSEVLTTPVKATIVFTEYDGDKKTKSLPYALYINAPDATELKPGWVKLRVGSRVPIYRGGTSENKTYLDVGTTIDARSSNFSDDRLLLQMKIERSRVEGGVSVPGAKSECY